MLKLKNSEVDIQFSDINLKHRYFEKENIISVEIKINFYPKLINDRIVSGTIDLLVDTDKVNCLNDLSGLKFSEGRLSVTINDDGLWNTFKYNDFNLEFGNLVKNKLDVKLSLDEIEFDDKAVVLSLYTFNEDALKKNFDMSSFYEKSILRQMSNKEISKFYTKN